jgi:homocysteine S-methyltransferase
MYYFFIAAKYGLPLLTGTPTWRASPDRVKKSLYAERGDMNKDAFRYVDGLRDRFGPHGKRIYIGGLMGCQGDAYEPGDALSEEEASSFHEAQARELADAGVDYLMAATLPALSEAKGIARAMSRCSVPYIVSFVASGKGALLDGTPLEDAIRAIDGSVDPQPLLYMIREKSFAGG